jgi:hypothetical protein
MKYQLKRMLALAVLAIETVLLAACSTDPNEAANKLFIEAQQVIEKAGKQQKAADKLPLLRDAEERLKAIVSKYPAANLAVQLASGQSVGIISLKSVADDIARMRQEICFNGPTRTCLFDQAIVAALAITDGKLVEDAFIVVFDRVSTLSHIALAQFRAGLRTASSGTIARAQALYAGGYEFPAGLAGTGSSEEALGAIQSRKEFAHPGVRYYLLMHMAMAQAESGLQKEAIATLGDARRMAAFGQDDSVDDAGTQRLQWILAIQARAGVFKPKGPAGEIDQALKLAQAMAPRCPPLDRRYLCPFTLSLLGTVADIQAQLGQNADARSTLARAFEMSASQPVEIMSIFFYGEYHVSPRPHLCALADVKAIVASLADNGVRSSMLLCGVRGRAEIGNIQDAQSFLYLIESKYLRVLGLSYVAQAQTKAKLTSQAMATISEALRAVQELQEPGQRAHALLALASAVPE